MIFDLFFMATRECRCRCGHMIAPGELARLKLTPTGAALTHQCQHCAALELMQIPRRAGSTQMAAVRLPAGEP
jgi:hypothetical protein